MSTSDGNDNAGEDWSETYNQPEQNNTRDDRSETYGWLDQDPFTDNARDEDYLHPHDRRLQHPSTQPSYAVGPAQSLTINVGYRQSTSNMYNRNPPFPPSSNVPHSHFSLRSGQPRASPGSSLSQLQGATSSLAENDTLPQRPSNLVQLSLNQPAQTYPRPTQTSHAYPSPSVTVGTPSPAPSQVTRRSLQTAPRDEVRITQMPVTHNTQTHFHTVHQQNNFGTQYVINVTSNGIHVGTLPLPPAITQTFTHRAPPQIQVTAHVLQSSQNIFGLPHTNHSAVLPSLIPMDQQSSGAPRPSVKRQASAGDINDRPLARSRVDRSEAGDQDVPSSSPPKIDPRKWKSPNVIRKPPPNGTKEEIETCLTCLWYSRACKGTTVDGKSRCQNCAGGTDKTGGKGKHSRKCYWKDPANGINTYEDARNADPTSYKVTKNTREYKARQKKEEERKAVESQQQQQRQRQPSVQPFQPAQPAQQQQVPMPNFMQQPTIAQPYNYPAFNPMASSLDPLPVLATSYNNSHNQTASFGPNVTINTYPPVHQSPLRRTGPATSGQIDTNLNMNMNNFTNANTVTSTHSSPVLHHVPTRHPHHGSTPVPHHAPLMLDNTHAFHNGYVTLSQLYSPPARSARTLPLASPVSSTASGEQQQFGYPRSVQEWDAAATTAAAAATTTADDHGHAQAEDHAGTAGNYAEAGEDDNDDYTHNDGDAEDDTHHDTSINDENSDDDSNAGHDES